MSSIFGLSDAPPRGWRIVQGELVADPTVAGYLARGREIRGLCQQQDCRRTCQVDLEDLARRGLGAARIQELKPLYKCQRLGGCALAFHEKYGTELTVSVLARLKPAVLRIRCGNCRKTTRARPGAVVARLLAEGLGGHETRVEDLAGLIRGECRGCRVRRWEVAVLWGPRDGPGGPGAA